MGVVYYFDGLFESNLNNELQVFSSLPKMTQDGHTITVIVCLYINFQIVVVKYR